jgi:S-DNA-T family DNA segregation ATPase FtsK/SpoIIIE
MSRLSPRQRLRTLVDRLVTDGLPDGLSRSDLDTFVARHEARLVGLMMGGRGKATGGHREAEIQAAFGEARILADVAFVMSGPRLDRYRVEVAGLADLDRLRATEPRLRSLLGTQATVTAAAEARTFWLDLLRERTTWLRAGLAELQAWARAGGPKGACLPLWLGLDPLGQPYVLDLAAAPHVLVGGTTGSGKSVLLHALVASLVRGPTPVELVLIDPKHVEMALWQGAKRVRSIVSEPDDIRRALDEAIEEMERRYRDMAERRLRECPGDLPRLVLVVDELAELVDLVPGADERLRRLARTARACGIHLIVATQRPDAVILDGQIRANVPVRISLAVNKATESRIILDEQGAENLPKPGDALVRQHGGTLDRVHVLYLSSADIDALRGAP